MVILGALDIELFDFDFDVDSDADMDIEIESPGFLRAVLEFFYIGEVPVMVLVSIFVVVLWFFSILGNYYLNPGRGLLIGTMIATGNIFVSLLLTRIISMPFRAFFKAFDDDPNAPKKVVGRIGVVLTSQISDKMGQLEVSTKGAPLVLNARTSKGEVLTKGQEALVTGHDKDRSVYFVEPVE